MHPEIRKFWEKAGYKVSMTSPYGDNKLIFYHASVSNGIIHSKMIAISNEVNGEKLVAYFINEKTQSEDQMLRIIRLKAFL